MNILYCHSFFVSTHKRLLLDMNPLRQIPVNSCKVVNRDRYDMLCAHLRLSSLHPFSHLSLSAMLNSLLTQQPADPWF